MVQLSHLYMTTGKTTALTYRPIVVVPLFMTISLPHADCKHLEERAYGFTFHPHFPPCTSCSRCSAYIWYLTASHVHLLRLQLHSQTTLRWDGIGTNLHLPSEKTTESREVTPWPLIPVVCLSSLAGSASLGYPSTFLGSSWLKDLCPYFSYLSLPLT